MNKTVEKAIEINKKSELNGKAYIPNLEIGDVCKLEDICDGNCDERVVLKNSSYSELISYNGEDGNSNYEIWIHYFFEVVELKENLIDSIVKILKIELS